MFHTSILPSADRAWRPFEPSAQRPWNRARAAHLLRRAGCAATSAELDDAARRSPSESVGRLLKPDVTDQSRRREDEFAELAKRVVTAGSPKGLSAWWLYRMIHTADVLREKTTLFWHGHFATGAEKVTDAGLMLAQNELFRKHALGRFADLVNGISRDPAMLIYLDSKTNRKTRPNENFARELMELFCLGVGNYTEKDIQELARCFTGWEVRDGKFRFNENQHDFGRKTVLGRSGDFDGDAGAKIVVEQPAASRFIARKLVRFFVCDEPELSDDLVEPLAKDLRDHGFDVGRVVATILQSELFFSEHAIGRKVRSPVELGVGLVRALEATTNAVKLAEDLAQLGQNVFYPPNVKGWDGGRTWINSSSLLGRANLVRRLASGKETQFAAGSLADLANRYNARSAGQIVDWLVDLLVALPIPGNVRKTLVAVAERKGNDDNSRIANTIHAIGALPEFQLS